MIHIGNGGSAFSEFESSPPNMMTKIPTRGKNTIRRSNLRIFSSKMRKANTTTTIGTMLATIEMIVAGMNFVTEYLIRLVVTPVNVLNARGLDCLHSILSQQSLFSYLL